MKVYYFDANVFIAYFNSSQVETIASYGQDSLDGIGQLIDEMKRDNLVIMTSSLTIAEIKPLIKTNIEVYDDFLDIHTLSL